MTLTDLLQTFQELGIQLRAQEGRLRVEAPALLLMEERTGCPFEPRDTILGTLEHRAGMADTRTEKDEEILV